MRDHARNLARLEGAVPLDLLVECADLFWEIATAARANGSWASSQALRFRLAEAWCLIEAAVALVELLDPHRRMCLMARPADHVACDAIGYRHALAMCLSRAGHLLIDALAEAGGVLPTLGRLAECVSAAQAEVARLRAGPSEILLDQLRTRHQAVAHTA